MLNTIQEEGNNFSSFLHFLKYSLHFLLITLSQSLYSQPRFVAIESKPVFVCSFFLCFNFMIIIRMDNNLISTIDVKSFVSENITSYEGDASFLC